MDKELEHIDIHDLLPQQPPFVMVDRLEHYDEEKTVTSLDVRPDNLFVEDGRLVQAGLTENIAQTCAARMGYRNLSRGGDVVLGYIGAIRNLQVMRTPRVGEHLVTTIEVLNEVFQMTLVSATIESDGQCLVQAELKIALSDIAKQG